MFLTGTNIMSGGDAAASAGSFFLPFFTKGLTASGATSFTSCPVPPPRVCNSGPYFSTQERPMAAASSGVSQDHSAPRARIAIQRVSPRTECSSTEYGPTV